MPRPPVLSRKARSTWIAWATLTLVALLHCTKTSPGEKPSAPAAGCKRDGDRCEYAVGKIGLCTAKPDCAEPPCLTCVSLH